jgi:DNA-directed RNA polymerase subunit RPC12/RpoP
MSRAYADVPVVKSKYKDGVACPECGFVAQVDFFNKQQTFITEDQSRYFCSKCDSFFNNFEVCEVDEYSRGQWQIDARAKWNSSGNRFLATDEISSLPIDQINKYFSHYMKNNRYDYDRHVEIAKYLEESGRLPAAFQTLNVPGRFEYVWHGVNRMLTLNGEQSRKNLAMHICPLQFDIVDRVINRYSNKGELVFDPFAGLMTVPYRALKLGRRGYGVELNPESYRDGVRYLEAIEQEVESASLFDIIEEAA